MKEGWERTGIPITLDLRQMSDIIKPVFPDKRIVSAERIGTGFSNTNYKIHLSEGSRPFVFRLYRGSKEIADKEFALAELVHKTVPVADFIYADTSCSVLEQPWAILEWKEGILLRDVLKSGSFEDIAAPAAAVGKVLADIHAFSFPESGFFDGKLKITYPIRMDGDFFLSFMEESLFHNQCGKWLGEEITQKLWLFCKASHSALSENSEKPVLVHSDFNGLNLLMQPDSTNYSVSAVLDWEFAFAWSRHADIANMLRYEEDDSPFERHFIQAYQAQGIVLADNWKHLSKLEDLIALCDLLNNSTTETPNRVRDLRRLIARTVQTNV
ncbi:phosphotransferase family protein [Alicyclobacillus fodiniaquatilis]|uniref:Phosphotransferase family protein n=1 Tax=Alicyclobacillus fodiniaquatilis TaxID=1661150 RepID=A0ABW4JDM6_9BACL